MTTSPGPERAVIGHVIAPEGLEATLDGFYFWALPETWVEKTQKVMVECEYQGGRRVRFYGVVDEASYVTEGKSVHDDRLRREQPGLPGGPIDQEGTGYYRVELLATDPEVYIPPVAGANVYLASEDEVAFAYGFDRIRLGAPVGLIKNGARAHCGPAVIDLAYLLGENGAHLNVNGISGVATKTSALLVTVMSLVQTLGRRRRENPSARDNLRAVPVLFSVKGTDMLWLDRPSRPFSEDAARAEHWHRMGLEPRPFRDVRFLVPARPGEPDSPRPVVARNDLRPYSWGLADIIEAGLLRYLFSEGDRDNQNFAFLLGQWEKRLTMWDRGRRVLRPREHGTGYNENGGTPQTFAELEAVLEQFIDTNDEADALMAGRMNHAHIATVQAFFRRLKKLEYEHGGALAWRESKGSPPRIGIGGEHEAYVIDIASLAGSPDMQRFVIAAVMDQLVAERSATDAPYGVRYLVALDELNQWAPRGSNDPTTRLFEKVSAEMRSKGIILLGAQQFASQVSAKVTENASVRMMGRTGPGELSDEQYRFLTTADKRMVSRLEPGEQLLTLPSFRVPAHMDVPFPAWAMRFEEVLDDADLMTNASRDAVGPMFSYQGSVVDD